MIESVYASKEKFDVRCAAQRWPTQTLSKYFDEFFKHKYGLRSMARGHAEAVRKAVEAFEGEDNYVRVFGMTLRNEVYEFGGVDGGCTRGDKDSFFLQPMFCSRTAAAAAAAATAEVARCCI